MRWTTALAWGLGALTPLEIAVGVALGPSRHTNWPIEVTLVIQAFVGALLAWRRPRNPIGWIFVATSALLELGNPSGGPAPQYALTLLATAPTEAQATARVAGAIGSFASNIVLVLPLLLFPNGRLLSWRWLPVAILQCGMAVFAFVWETFARPAFTLGTNDYANPLAIVALADVYTALIPPGELVSVLILIAAVISLFRRYRRSRGDERQQLKWLALGGGISVLAAATGVAGGAVFVISGVKELPTYLTDVVAPIVNSLYYLGPPIAMGIALLKYRLYDVDVVMNRTLVYGATTVTLVAAYAAAVLIATTLLRTLTQGQELAVALATVTVAALIQPVRRQIQTGVDRRFYRKRYDADSMIDAFTRRIGDEVDLDALRRDLLAIVGDAVEPAHAGVWLRPR